MTGLLKDTLEKHAQEVASPHFDVAVMVRDGHRTVRRRRTALVGGVAALAVAAGIALPQLLPGGVDRAVPEPTVADGTGAFVAAYAVGTTLYLGDRELELPTRPRTMVQTTSGVVYADEDGEVWATNTDRTDGGPATRPAALPVGMTDRRFPELTADGDRAAWVETGGEVPEFAVLEHTDHSVVSSPLANDPATAPVGDARDPAVVYALDGDVVYLHDRRGAVAWNFLTDAQEVLEADADGFSIDDVQDGRIAYSPHPEDEDRYRVGPDLRSGQAVDAWNGSVLSPAGTYLLGEDGPDSAAVFEVATGRRMGDPVTGHAFFGGYAWVDDDTYLGIGFDAEWDSSPVDILSCDVGGACETVLENLPTVQEGLRLPLGEPFD